MRRVGVTSKASEDYKTFHALNAKVKNGAKGDDPEWGLEIDIFILSLTFGAAGVDFQQYKHFSFSYLGSCSPLMLK